MNPNRLTVKIPVAGHPVAVDLEPWIGLFHGFIQQGSVEGLLVDVADYAHVPQGPGVVLIGHEVDYQIDLAGGVAGLMVTRKRLDGAPLAESLRDTLRKAFVAVAATRAAGAPVDFDTSALVVRIVDRAVAANAPDAYEVLVKETEAVLRDAFGDAGPFELSHADSHDPRRALALAITLPEPADAAGVIERLGGARSAGQAAGGGAGGWDVPVEVLERLRKEKADFVLLDVREEHEYAEVNLGGHLIPLDQLSERLAELDHRAHVVVHCKMGGRGARAVALLREAGFENAWNLRGGLDAWIEMVDPDLGKS